MDVAPACKTTLAESVMGQIAALMRNGQLQSGEKPLSEIELLVALNVSRPTVREARTESAMRPAMTQQTR